MKQRRPYRRSVKPKLSDKDVADNIMRDIREELREYSGNFRAIFLWLCRQKKSIQHRVLDAFRPLAKKGRPVRPITDKDFCQEVDGWKAYLLNQAEQAGVKAKISDLAAIRDLLTTTETRWGRERGVRFDPHSKSGKAEVERFRDAVSRARRAAKSK